VNVPEAAVGDPTSSPESSPSEAEEDFGAEMSDEELGELLVREITIDGMCGVY
jgi:mycofactocin precursor